MNILLGTAQIETAAEATTTSTAAVQDNHYEFLSFDATTIVGTLLNTLLLFLVLKHFLFDKVNKVLNDRNSDVAKTFEEADRAKADAEALKAEYEEKVAGAKAESAEIIKNASRKAQEHSEEIIGEARDEAHSIIEKANAEIEIEKKHAVNQIKDEISDIALSVAEKVVGREIDGATHEQLISGFIDGIGS